MLYGLILESARQYIISVHGESVWKSIVNELKLPSDTFDLCSRYDHKLIFYVCDCE